MTPEHARDAYDSMGPEDQEHVKGLIAQGFDRVKAVSNVAAQRSAFNIGKNEREAEIETGGPTTGEKVSSAAMGVASALSPTLILKKQYRDKIRAGEEAAAAQAPGAFGGGHLAGDAVNAAQAAAGAPALVRGVAAGASAAKNAAVPVLRRIGSAVKEAPGAVLDEGLRPAGMKLINKALGRGGAVADDAIVAADAVPGPPSIAEPLGTSLDDLMKPAAQPSPSGLELVPRPPALPIEAKPLAPIPEMPANVMAGPAAPKPPAPMPADVMAGGPPKLTPKPTPVAGPADSLPPPTLQPKATMPAAPGAPAKPPPGVTFSDPTIDPHAMADAPVWGAVDDMARRAFQQALQQAPLAPAATSAAKPMGEAALKAAVKEGVAKGVPIKELAASLGVNQGDINAFFQAAQLGFL